jgi:hypothetical protein
LRGTNENPRRMSQYYRNNKDVTSIEGIEVDAGSLWKTAQMNSNGTNELKRNQTEQIILILEDDDQYATAYLNENFEIAL